MKIEITISEKVNTLDEFLNSVARENSKFTVWKRSDELATIHFDGIGYGTTVYLVKGVVNTSVINTLKPTIELKGTLLYRIFQFTIIGFFVFMLSFLIHNFELFLAAIIVLGCLTSLGVLQLFYKFAEGVFEGNFFDEINYGQTIQDDQNAA